MAPIKTSTIRALTIGATISAAIILGPMFLAADEDEIQLTVGQTQVMAQLALPSAPGSFAVAVQNAPQDDLVTANCVDRLDNYLEPMIITFRLGETLVTSENTPLLSHIAALVTSCKAAHVLVAGHADGSSDDRTSLALSWERADETLNRLVTLGVDPAALEAIGFGARAPMAQGSDDDDAANRRVDFRVLHKRN
jgi:outer membrane protein OmpA-like peptidoglycan-associated protein